MPNYEKSFRTIIDRYGDNEFWEKEKNQKAFGLFMDYMREVHKDIAFDSDEARSIFRLSRFRVNQELVYKNYDLFAKNFQSGADDKENIKVLRETGKILKLENVRKMFGDSYSISKGKRFYNVRDARGRFVKKS